MASASVVHLTDATFQKEVLESDVPVLVDVWAEWCGPCQQLAPMIDDLAEQFKGKAKVAKLESDTNRATVMGYSISALPTVIVFSKGKEVKRFVGVKPGIRTDLKNALEAAGK